MQTIVTCVERSTARIICHHEKLSNPLERNSSRDIKIASLATVGRLDSLDTDGLGRPHQRLQEEVPRKEIALVDSCCDPVMKRGDCHPENARKRSACAGLACTGVGHAAITHAMHAPNVMCDSPCVPAPSSENALSHARFHAIKSVGKFAQTGRPRQTRPLIRFRPPVIRHYFDDVGRSPPDRIHRSQESLRLAGEIAHSHLKKRMSVRWSMPG